MEILQVKESKKRPFKQTGQFNPPLNPFTLSFPEVYLNHRYEEYVKTRSLGYLRISLILAISLYAFFAWIDQLLTPEVVIELAGVRIVSILGFICFLYLTYIDWGIRNYHFLTIVTVLFAGVGIMSIILISDSIGGYHYYAGLILAVMFAHGLMRMRFIFATLTTWFIIAVYFSATIILEVTPFEILMNNIFFLVSANVMGMFASYWLEYYMKAEFWKEQMLNIKNSELQEEHDRKSNELEAARRMQLNMLPERSPILPEYQFSFSMRAASEVGGDYYDFKLSKENELTFGIGDSTGHGLQASVMVTAIKLLFSEYAGISEPVEFLKHASRSISLMGFRKFYMAFAIGRLYNDNMEIAGAGMPPALIYRSKTRIVEEVSLKGLPLGSQVLYPYNKTVVSIDQGDVVLLLSDGLPELFNKEGEMVGYERVKEIFAEIGHLEPEAIMKHFHNFSESWLDGENPNDDMTFFIIKRKQVLKEVGNQYVIDGSSEISGYPKLEKLL